MAVTYHSIGAIARNDLPHPSGLEVGDLMIACVLGQNSNAIGTPTGWTQKVNSTVTNATSGTNRKIGMFYKVADSDDVTNGQTSFSQAAGGVMGAILRTTGGDASNLITNTTSSSSSPSGSPAITSPNLNASITPATVESLMIMFWGSYIGTDTEITASGYAINTNNPSWTERLDSRFFQTGEASFGVHIATATREEVTASGNSTVTYNTNVYGTGIILASLGLPNDSTFNAEPLILNSVLPNPTLSADANYTADPLVANSALPNATYTQTDGKWSKESKPSTTWTKQPKI